MANKDGIFFTNQPGAVPAAIIDDWASRWTGRIPTAVERASFVGGTRTDFQNNIAMPSAANFAASLPDTAVFSSGLTGAQVKVKQRANIFGRGADKWFTEIADFFGNAAAIERAVAKGRRNLRFLTQPLAVTGIKALFHGMSAAAWRFIDQDLRWRRLPGSQAQILTDDQDSCFEPTLSRAVVPALNSLTIQTLTILKQALEAQTADPTTMTTFAAQQNARMIAVATGALKTGVAIDVGVVVNPVLGLHIKCMPDPVTPPVPDLV